MVSPIPSPPPLPSAYDLNRTPELAHHDPLQEDHTPYVEQHFPHQMSWYAPEGPQGSLESAALWIRENPWPALGIAAASGLLLALLTGPAARSTSAGAKALFRRSDTD